MAKAGREMSQNVHAAIYVQLVKLSEGGIMNREGMLLIELYGPCLSTSSSVFRTSERKKSEWH